MDGSTHIERQSDDPQRVKVLQATGFVVVGRSVRGVLPPYRVTYTYEHFATLGDAIDMHADYERGEYRGMDAAGIFPVRFGMPFGPALDPGTLAKLMRETASS